jgi:hypothetical protein
MRIEGIITGAFSEPVNRAPVVADILQDDGTYRSIGLERRCWNDFVDGESPLFFGQTRVVVEGEGEYNCSIGVI